MQKQTIYYSHREYDSRITTDSVHRCYFGTGQAHQIQTQKIKNQLTEMLGWINEHMVLPTEESRAIANWALESDTHYKTKTTIPKTWDITDPKQIWTNPRTGYTKHTRPSAIGVLGGMVMNSLTQREFTEPQIQGLNHLFRSMTARPGCWKTPGHEQMKWAEEWDRQNPDNPGGHGMGDLSKSCDDEQNRGRCPACGAIADLWPSHWIAYEFVHQETAQRDTEDRLGALFR